MLLGNPTGATSDSSNHNHYLTQRVLTTVYSGSGYDRGHMCPSGDRTVSVTINDETFLMSNMIPQAPVNNQGIWANLETYCRNIAASNEVLITCGPEGFGTSRSNVWKIIVAVPLDRGDHARIIAVNIPNIQGIRSDPWQNYLTSVNQLQTNTGFTFFTALNSNLATVLRARVDGSPATGITNFTPSTGFANTSVVIRGTNFAGTTNVRFNGQDATFTLNSPNQISATIPPGATTGFLAVIAAGGISTSATSFTVNSLAVAQPTLSISLSGSNVFLSWPTNATGYTLRQNSDLNSTNWASYAGIVTVSGTNRTATIAAPAGNLFFRLSNP